jgi:hypothetical protein
MKSSGNQKAGPGVLPFFMALRQLCAIEKRKKNHRTMSPKGMKGG